MATISSSVTAAGPQLDVAAPGPALQTQEWQVLSGPWDGTPTSYSSSNGEYVFVTDQFGQPFYHQRVGGAWSSPPTALGGVLNSVVVAAEPGPAPTNVELFGVGADDAVWYRTLTSGWQFLGGITYSNPAAIQHSDGTYAFVIGGDGALYYQRIVAGLPSGWSSLGGQLFSDPTVLVEGGTLHVMALGNDGALWTRRLAAGTWSAWQSLGGTLVSYPTATSPNASSAVSAVFAIGTDNAVWYRQLYSGTWGGWTPLGGLSLSGVAVNQSSSGLSIFVIGFDGAMYTRRQYAGSVWGGWQSLGNDLYADPAAIVGVVVSFDIEGYLVATAY